MVEVYFENNKYGIKDNGVLRVPVVYREKISAIEEQEYFERLNINEQQFLPHKRTHEEITEIVNFMKNTINC